MAKIPVGTIMLYAGDTGGSSIINLLESGWLLCDGSRYRRTSGGFSPLFTVIGEAFGGGGGRFCVPMCRGVFLRGVTGDSSTDPDAATRTAPRPDMPNVGNDGPDIGSMQSHAIQAHSHGYSVYSSSRNQDHVSGHDTINNQTASNITTAAAGGLETRPANIYANFIIKFVPDDSSIAIGTIVPYAGPLPNPTLVSNGWLSCDGTAIDSGTYADLYDVIQSFYGAKPPAFCLPDYRGRFVRGLQGVPPTGVHVYDPEASTRTAPTTQPTPGNSGNNVGSLQADAFMLHQHLYNFNDAYQWTAGTLIGFDGVDHGDSYAPGTAAAGGNETRPVNINVNYLIKAGTAGSEQSSGGMQYPAS